MCIRDSCKIAITGLSEYSYGTLTGTVTSIDSDVTSSTNGSYYKMTIKPDNTYVVSTSGDKVDLSNGMSVTARVEYDELTYFDYVDVYKRQVQPLLKNFFHKFPKKACKREREEL